MAVVTVLPAEPSAGLIPLSCCLVAVCVQAHQVLCSGPAPFRFEQEGPSVCRFSRLPSQGQRLPLELPTAPLRIKQPILPPPPPHAPAIAANRMANVSGFAAAQRQFVSGFGDDQHRPPPQQQQRQQQQQRSGRYKNVGSRPPRAPGQAPRRQHAGTGAAAGADQVRRRRRSGNDTGTERAAHTRRPAGAAAAAAGGGGIRDYFDPADDDDDADLADGGYYVDDSADEYSNSSGNEPLGELDLEPVDLTGEDPPQQQQQQRQRQRLDAVASKYLSPEAHTRVAEADEWEQQRHGVPAPREAAPSPVSQDDGLQDPDLDLTVGAELQLGDEDLQQQPQQQRFCIPKKRSRANQMCSVFGDEDMEDADAAAAAGGGAGGVDAPLAGGPSARKRQQNGMAGSNRKRGAAAECIRLARPEGTHAEQRAIVLGSQDSWGAGAYSERESEVEGEESGDDQDDSRVQFVVDEIVTDRREDVEDDFDPDAEELAIRKGRVKDILGAFAWESKE